LTPLAGRCGAALLFVLIGSVVGCSHHSSPEKSPRPSEGKTDIPLEVTNHNWLDIVISVIHDGQRTRVGTANGTSSSSFALPARLLSQGREIRFVGHPIGGSDSVITEPVVVQPGQYIEWTLESDLRRSSIGVY
jgi:hypothetical protein